MKLKNFSTFVHPMIIGNKIIMILKENFVTRSEKTTIRICTENEKENLNLSPDIIDNNDNKKTNRGRSFFIIFK